LRLTIRNFSAMTLVLMLALGTGSAKTRRHTTAHSSKKSTSKAASHSSSHSASSKHHRGHVKRGSWKHHGQQGIQPERARAIQEALIREKYLDGEPSGQWDSRTQNAMARYQADNRWQSKVTPDARALIKLGLGPNHAENNRLNMQTTPSTDAVASTAPTARR
jgi:hypothetical protein